MKRAVMLAIPAILAVIVFVPIGNRILYWSLFVLMFILVYAFHIMEDVVPMKDITAQLGTDDFFSLKCGYVKIINGQKAELQKGVMVIYAQTVLFYVRAKASGGARLVQSIPAETIDTYTLCKVDGYHQGVTFTLNGGDEVHFTQRRFRDVEADMRTAIGWPEEEKVQPSED